MSVRSLLLIAFTSLLFTLAWAHNKAYSKATREIFNNHGIQRRSVHGGNYSASKMWQTELSSKNPRFSSPKECARNCKEGESPKICYYHFTLELYNTLGSACELCTPNATNMFESTCQCVLADGVEKSFLSINRMFPGPSIQVCQGDKVVIDVENHIEGMGVTIHWHGIWQTGTQYYDGVPFVTQCPIQQGNTFRYQWVAGNAGTHFYHAHTGLQKLNGLHGSLVVRQPPANDPSRYLYDYDLTTHVILLSDWMHTLAEVRFPGLLVNNTGQAPDSFLINGKGKYENPDTGVTTNTSYEVFNVSAGNRYRFRIINSFATLCPAELTVEGHNITLIGVDGEPVNPVNITTITSFSGERYDFVLNANQTAGAYWIQVRGLGQCGDNRVQQLALLMYDGITEEDNSTPPSYDDGLSKGVTLNPLNATCNGTNENEICISQLKNAKEVDEDILTSTPDVKIYVPFRFTTFDINDLFVPNTYNKYLVFENGDHVMALVDNISYIPPPSPPLSQYQDLDPQIFCNGDSFPEYCDEDDEYCMCTHKIDIPLDAIVELILIDEIQAVNISHPFHLHGYSFKVIGMGLGEDQNISAIAMQDIIDLDTKGLLNRQYEHPPGKDTIAIPTNGYTILRFKADNPGYWFFHCHFMYHIAVGMEMILHVGTQSDLPPVPPSFPTCGDHQPDVYLDDEITTTESE